MTEYRIKQGGVVVAQSNSLTEIWHYAYQYAKDGTVHVQVKDGRHWKDIFTARAEAYADELEQRLAREALTGSATVKESLTTEDEKQSHEWKCPIDYPGCRKYCGSPYGCKN